VQACWLRRSKKSFAFNDRVESSKPNSPFETPFTRRLASYIFAENVHVGQSAKYRVQPMLTKTIPRTPAEKIIR
jgi:hypothetical protein